MADLEKPQRDRLRRSSGEDFDAARTFEPATASSNAHAGATVGKRTLTESRAAALARGQRYGAVGKRTLAESSGVEGQAPGSNPVVCAAAVDAARRHLAALSASHESGDHYASSEAAQQLRLSLDTARGVVTEDQSAALATLEAEAAPLLASSFTPSRDAIDEALFGEGRTHWDRDVAAWRAVRERDWLARAAPFAAQLGIDATIRIDDAAVARGARGLAQAGVVHLAPTLAPEHGDALRILAHELVHVAQSRLPTAGALADAEREADELATALVHGALPHRPRIGIAAGVAAADNGATVVQASEQPFRAYAKQLTFAARRDWLETEAGFAETGKAPSRVLEMLLALQAQGGITWATRESLEKLASQTIATSRDAPTVEYAITSKTYETIGIPAASSAMVGTDGDGLVVIFRVNGIPAGHSIPLLPADLAMILDAIEAFTGLLVIPTMRTAVLGYTASTDRGENIAEVSFDRTAMHNLVGTDAWDAWATSQRVHHRDLSVPAPVLERLTDDEQARLAMWLTANLGLAATATPLTRFLLEVVDEIEHDKRYRDSIIAYLRSHALAGAIDPIWLGDAAQLARYAQDRVELRVTQPDQAFDDLPAIGSKAFDHTLPARLTQHSDLVLDGDNVAFEVAIDWSLTAMGSALGLETAAAGGGWSADVEWVFVRPELLGSQIRAKSHHDGDITFSQKLSLQPNEVQATWDVHAFVTTSHFLPTHVQTLVQVKTVAERMTNLRAAALGDPKLARAMQPDEDGHMLGPSTFTPMTPAQRAAVRDRERMNNELAAEYLEDEKKPENQEAIQMLRDDLNRRREEDAAIKQADADGLMTFDARATYLSQTDPIPSGPLRLYGTIEHESRVTGPWTVVKLHDQSRIIEQEDYTFTGSGTTFAMALENAFRQLASEYPLGRMDLFAEARDESGEHVTGQTLGFERETFSTAKKVKQYVFHPIAQAALGMATVIAMICAPEVGIPLMISIAYGAASTVDDIITHSQNDTLTVGRFTMDMTTLALSVLPFAAAARPIAESGAALFMLRVIDTEGQVIVMTLQAKEELERLQANEVASLGKLYKQMVDLQSSTHPSDPRLTQLRDEMDAKAAEARDLLAEACMTTYEQGGLTLIQGLVGEVAISGMARGPHSSWPELVVEEGIGGRPHPAETSERPARETESTDRPVGHEQVTPEEQRFLDTSNEFEDPAARRPRGLGQATESDVVAEPELELDHSGGGRAKETTATAVPGSSFQGRARSHSDHASEKRAAAEVKAAGQQAMESAAKLVPEIVGAPEKVSSAHVEGNGWAARDERARLDDTYIVRLTDPPPLTVRVTSGPVAGGAVAKASVNASKEGSNRVGADGSRVEVKGRYVIALSDAMDPTKARRAIAHELAEIVDERRLSRAKQNAPADALTLTSDAGAVLSPHDHGRIAEIRDLVDQIRAGVPGAEREMLALVEHLGLRNGGNAVHRRALIEPLLDNEARGLLGRFTADTLEPTLRGLLDGVRAQAAHDTEIARQLQDARRAVVVPHPDAAPAPGEIVDEKQAAKLAGDAMEELATKSAATLGGMRGQMASLPKGEYLKVSLDLQIGGGAGLAARDPHALLVDKRGRWQADPSERIAQTAAQLRGLIDAGIGDPFQFARPDERVPMSAIKLWEDTIAARGPVIDGGVVSVKVEVSGRTLVEIAPTMGGGNLTIELTGRIVTSPGFPPERIPGTPFGMSPEKALAEIKAQLAKLIAEPSTAQAIKTEAQAALAEIEPLSAIEMRPGARESDLSTARKALDSRGLAAVMAKDLGNAYKMAVAGDAWKTLQMEHPGKVLLGDAANLSSVKPLATDRWVIGGAGGTSISAAEILLNGNPKAHVTIAGMSPPPGLIDNTQFQETLKAHADVQTARLIEALTGTKLTPGDGRFSLVLGVEVGTPVESGGEIRIDSPTPAGYEGGQDPLAGGGYVSGIGREGQLPPVVAEMVMDAKKNGLVPGLDLMFDDDRQYLGYRVLLRNDKQTVRSVDVTGAASRFVPWDLVPVEDESVMKERFRAATDLDAPPESGNFDGGFVASATQAVRYAIAQKSGGSK